MHLQVVLAHPPESLALFQRAPSGRYSDGWIFSFRGATEKFFLLACIGEEVRILHSSKFYFFKTMFKLINWKEGSEKKILALVSLDLDERLKICKGFKIRGKSAIKIIADRSLAET